MNESDKVLGLFLEAGCWVPISMFWGNKHWEKMAHKELAELGPCPLNHSSYMG